MTTPFTQNLPERGTSRQKVLRNWDAKGRREANRQKQANHALNRLDRALKQDAGKNIKGVK